MYQLVKSVLFRYDPEVIHEKVMSSLSWCGRHPGALRLISTACQFNDPRLTVKRFGLTFPNPVGLAAGFDKNAVAIPSWAALGFGAVEIGSVTALAQPGNPKPRLFRLPADQAIINRMGFNNDGAEVIARRLAKLNTDYGSLAVPLGVNLGKSKVTPLEQAAEDYLRSVQVLQPFADYFVINISSPNTPGLRKLQDKDKLADLLAVISSYESAASAKPILLKIAPELSFAQIDEILELVFNYNLAGIIATNTTTSRNNLSSSLDEAGGLSGKPLASRSLAVLKHLRAQLQDRLPIISVGGIFSAQDVYERLVAGASLVQVYTSFIYEGPLLLRRLNQGLLQLIERDGFSNVEAAIGSRAPD